MEVEGTAYEVPADELPLPHHDLQEAGSGRTGTFPDQGGRSSGHGVSVPMLGRASRCRCGSGVHAGRPPIFLGRPDQVEGAEGFGCCTRHAGRVRVPEYEILKTMTPANRAPIISASIVTSGANPTLFS